MFGLQRRETSDRPRILEIRAAEQKDVEGIAHVDSRSLDAWGEDVVRRVIRDPHNRFTVAVVRGELVGFAIYTHLCDVRIFELGRVELLKDFRRQGIGTLIVRQIQADCFDGMPPAYARKTWIRTTLAESNTAALCFLRSCGFGRPTVLKDYFGDEDGIRQFWQPPLDDLLP